MLGAPLKGRKWIKNSRVEKAANPRFDLWMRLAVILAAALVAVCALAGTAAAQQNYLDEYGQPSFSSPVPVEYGYVEQANGHLHLEIPISNAASQRGTKQGLQFKIVYDSNIWTPSYELNTWAWSPLNVPNGNVWSDGGGWHLLPALAYTTVGWNGAGDQEFTDANQTTHYFPIHSSTNAFAEDSSGYYLMSQVASGGNSGSAVYEPDGSLAYFYFWGQHSNPQAVSEDPNGNYVARCVPQGVSGPCNVPNVSGYSYNYGGYGDTVGRLLLGINDSGVYSNGTEQTLFTTTNSQGTTSSYTVSLATINVSTAFGQQGISECSGQYCIVMVVQSIQLPDGNSYSFKYDCDDTISSQSAVCGSPSGQSAYYGELTQMTTPQGGTINYSWQVFSDSYKNSGLWLKTRTAAGGTWTYTPQVISNCSASQVGCQESLTVLTPSGRSTTTTTTLDNGAWPTKVQDQMSTTTTTWDFSHACVISGCIGHSYITKQAETQTITGAGGVQLTKQAAYTYDTQSGITYDGLVTATKEWEYQPGSNPSFPSTPDRATYTTWYSPASSPVATYGGTNVHQPASVTVCNNSGSDSACPGGGSRVSQTVTTYDGATLTSVSSSTNPVVNQDYYNYPASLTVRGLPTTVQQWVSGSTYLSTTYQYDNTGQLLQSTDSAGNLTKYSYTDSYFTDNGSNPPATYTASGTTNAYPTTITLPPVNGVSFIEKFGYYYGSGKSASSTDFNSNTTYYHFMDALDRPTATIFPIGWSFINYTSPTQADTYVAVGDTAPPATQSTPNSAPGCTSCRHEQITYDGLGRTISQQLTNASCQSETDTTYDSSGRVSTVTHPYCHGSSSVNETYAYDILDRVISVTHPDSQTQQTAYGTINGAPNQQGSTSTYGYGYPTLTTDEVGNQKESWSDGFGRLIEVDEPTQQGGTSGAPGAGSATVTGSEQSIGGQPPTSGSGSASTSGSEQVKYLSPTGSTATIDVTGTCNVSCGSESGSITINGVRKTFSVSNATGSAVASALATAARNTGLVSASSGTITSGVWGVYLSSYATGSSSNYSLSGSGSGRFSVSVPSGMTGGSNGPATYDTGSAWVTVNGCQASYSYGSSDTAGTVASGIESALGSTCGSSVTVGVSGTTITLTAKQTGTGSNYSLSGGSSTSQPTHFSSASFSVSVSGADLTGGTNGTATVYDSGTVSVTVNGCVGTANYGQYDTPSTVASNINTALNTNCKASITAGVSSGTISLTASEPGENTDYSLSCSSQTTEGQFSQPSFTFSPACAGSLTGGKAATSGSLAWTGNTGSTGSITVSGQEMCFPPCDAGTITVTVGSFQTQISYGQGSTASGLAQAIASALNGSGAVGATSSGGTVNITSNYGGSATNYAIQTSIASSEGINPPVFSVSPSNGQMNGGSDGSATSTFYTYDAAGNLKGVAQGVQTRSYVYDGLARLTSETTPEAGTVTYAYTNSGSLCSGDPSNACTRTDARNISTTYSYDAENRLTRRQYSDGTPYMVYNYDQATGWGGTTLSNPIGRLTTEGNSPSAEMYSYNAIGRVTEQWDVLPSNNVGATNFSYNPGGELTGITYPSGRVVTQSYDNVGHLNQVASNGTNYLTIPSADYDASERPLYYTYGNNIAASMVYSPSRSQLSSLSYSNGGTTLFGLNYYYQHDPTNCPSGTTSDNGLIECVVDVSSGTGAGGRTANYAYDPLGRLTSAQTNGSTNYPAWGLAMTYDRYGNRLSEEVTSGSGPDNALSFSANDGALTNRPDGYSFDASGNLLNDGAHGYSYDADDEITQVDSGSTATYEYNGDGTRVRRVANGTTTDIALGQSQVLDEYDNGAAMNAPTREYIYGLGQKVAEIDGATTFYYHNDHLSPRLLTDANGNVLTNQGHYPFGEMWYQNGQGTKWMFTSYPRDNETGNDYANARYLLNRFGRFMTTDPADTVAQNAASPQSWNLYAYTLNNPTNLHDPTGLWCVWEDGTHDDDPNPDDPTHGGDNIGQCLGAGGHWDGSDTIYGIWTFPGDTTVLKTQYGNYLFFNNMSMDDLDTWFGAANSLGVSPLSMTAPDIMQAACRKAVAPLIKTADTLGYYDALSSFGGLLQKAGENVTLEGGSKLAESTVQNLQATLGPAAAKSGIAAENLPDAALQMPAPSAAVKFMGNASTTATIMKVLSDASVVVAAGATLESFVLRQSACQ